MSFTQGEDDAKVAEIPAIHAVNQAAQSSLNRLRFHP
jgi:hypothetical protein